MDFCGGDLGARRWSVPDFTRQWIFYRIATGNKSSWKIWGAVNTDISDTWRLWLLQRSWHDISMYHMLAAQLMLTFPTSLTSWRCCRREQSGKVRNSLWKVGWTWWPLFFFLFSTPDTLQAMSDMLKSFEHVVRPQFSIWEDLLDKAVAEYYEGDSFGWEAASAACRYVAHQELGLTVPWRATETISLQKKTIEHHWSASQNQKLRDVKQWFSC